MTEFSPTDSTEQFDGTPGSGDLPAHEIVMPTRIDRYRVSELIGKGGFGAVFRASDESLGRDVAIKLPRRPKTGFADYERWKSEARMIAMMDHPNIVPVYDVGSTDEFPFYVVSKYIEGEDLRTHLNQHKPSVARSIGWVELMAEALQHAHANGLIHRDVKPSNILIDKNGQPWLTDFGLALREEEIGRDAGQRKLIGTVAYMSPEQARGEGHLVDGRADIFALGIIMYELLSGSRPFKGGSSEQLLRNIVRAEPRPLRQWDPRLPVELERICMKALAQRRVDRYDSAFDMAEDLRRYVAKKNVGERSSDSLSVDLSTTIIPKGLRSFDEHDRDFFFEACTWAP